MSTRYQQGRDLEYRVRDELIRLGYRVIRSAGSKTPVDLVAFSFDTLLFVQCKRSGALPPDKWNDLWDWAAEAGAVPVLAEQMDRGRRYWKLTHDKRERRYREPKIQWNPAQD